jgi:hypothetical protein
MNSSSAIASLSHCFLSATVYLVGEGLICIKVGLSLVIREEIPLILNGNSPAVCCKLSFATSLDGCIVGNWTGGVVYGRLTMRDLMELTFFSLSF